MKQTREACTEPVECSETDLRFLALIAQMSPEQKLEVLKLELRLLLESGEGAALREDIQKLLRRVEK